MKAIILMICMGSLYNVQCQEPQEENLSGRNLKNIPKSNSTDIRKLNLSQNAISLSTDDQTSLASYLNLTELDLRQNSITSLINQYFTALSTLEVLILKNNQITSVGEMALAGLKNLKILDLSFNLITQLPMDIQVPSVYLQTVNLQNNSLSNLDIKEALKDLKSPLKLTLSGNPWNCTCSLISLSLWLNTNTVVLENKDSTLCAAPNHMINYKVTAVNKALGTLLNCNDSGNVSSSTAPILSADNSSSPVTTSVNGTNTTSTIGNSWTFLVGVIVVGLATSLLILLAVKFPRWYDFILSYNHHRLKEEEPYMFEEEFNVDFNMGTNDRNQDDENVVVFEQMHSFVPEEDGFIEDKYIDERDITDS
ncbi:leucine-rich repeat-containing protein 19 [Phyllobates terribilis]|uniref:leucine-rich repeat-containing protein 19 n=1 Tax=Phyllobates terribilis TaxID=111132 RepID=UPI003CCAB10C